MPPAADRGVLTIDPLVERTFLNQAERDKYLELLEQVGPERAKVDWLTAKVILQNKRNFIHFCRHTMGYKEMNREHEALCEFLQYHPARIKLILMPRYTFKSCIVTIAHSLWCLLNDVNERILLYSDAAEKAEGFLLGVKNHILGLVEGQGFRQLTHQRCWEVDPQKQSWNQSAIVVAVRTQAQVEASIDTAGLETSKVGKHYSRIKFDDIVSDKNVTTKDLMDKTEECIKKSQSLLTPSGFMEFAGTRWHFGDAYGRMIAEYKGRPDFAVFHRKAFEGEHYFFANIGKDSLTPDFLARTKASQGTRLFSCLYQNTPVDDETATFKVVDFRFYQPAPTEAFKQWVSQLYITCVLDAIPPPTSDHGDDAAITVVGTDAEHTMFLLDAVASRMSPEQQIEEVLALHLHWRFRKFGLETNAFQKMLKSMLELRLRELRAKPHYHPFEIIEFSGVTQGNKERRIEGLQPWHEQGLLRFPGRSVERLTGVWSKLAYQMIEFPHSQHDDVLDSLAYHPQLKQAGSTTLEAVGFPYTSAAWFEQEQLKQLARQPRWKRRPLPELAFN